MLQDHPSHGAPAPDAAPATFIAALQELLAAERAGARMATESLRATIDVDARMLLTQIRRGEVDSCRCLSDSLRQVGAEPTRQISDFYDRAMAIPDIAQRLAFVDRGQRWVIRRVQALLPDCTNAFVRAQLQTVLDAHEANSGAYTRALP